MSRMLQGTGRGKKAFLQPLSYRIYQLQNLSVLFAWHFMATLGFREALPSSSALLHVLLDGAAVDSCCCCCVRAEVFDSHWEVLNFLQLLPSTRLSQYHSMAGLERDLRR